MSAQDFGWKAEGIERALACGGVELEMHTPPGFGRKPKLRQPSNTWVGSGMAISDPGPWDVECTEDREPPR